MLAKYSTTVKWSAPSVAMNLEKVPFFATKVEPQSAVIAYSSWSKGMKTTVCRMMYVWRARIYRLTARNAGVKAFVWSVAVVILRERMGSVSRARNLVLSVQPLRSVKCARMGIIWTEGSATCQITTVPIGSGASVTFNLLTQFTLQVIQAPTQNLKVE